jgi:hypothetical protein
MNRDKKDLTKPKAWHVQQEKILKDWGESSSCYRYMHFKAYQKYKSMSMAFTLPIIIISTLTGTANFAQETFPEAWQSVVPLGIGGLNLVAAIMTTVLQFMKANELMEGHRVAGISYGKLSRTIKLELALPIYERSQGGMDMIDRCRAEYDRLIEQSPPVPKDVLKKFDIKFPAGKETFTRPEISAIEEIELFDSTKENNAIASAASIFKKKIASSSMMAKKLFGSNPTEEKAKEMKVLASKNLVTTTAFNASARDQLQQELAELQGRGIVSLGPDEQEESVPTADDESHVVLDEIKIDQGPGT